MDFSRVRLIVYDCDGVLTDNRVYLSEEGREYAAFNRGDGLGVRMLKELGVAQIIISTEVNPIVAYRGKKLQIPTVHGAEDKRGALLSYCRQESIPLEEVLYIGNDLNDLQAMQAVGFRGCPKDAEPEIRAICDWISARNGGEGVVRDLYRAYAAWTGAEAE